MKICAIISEYNPMHNGHKYQIDKTRELTNCDAVVCIMSGNFVQRGQPSIIDKWQRTKMALNNGIDLVVELPSVFALSSAELFAQGAVKILNSTGIIDYLSFGSEGGNIDTLMEISKVLVNETPQFKSILKEYLDSGLTFPKARSEALIRYLSTISGYNCNISELLSTSNNILGIEYCKALIANNSKIIPITVKRLGGSYNSEELNNIFSSATSIRKHLKHNYEIQNLQNHIPKTVFEALRKLQQMNYNFTYPEEIFKFVKYKAVTDFEKSLSKLPDTGEGLFNRIYSAIKNSSSYDELIDQVKTKRYTYTRISRLLAQYFIGFEKYNISRIQKSDNYYVRVLGLNSTGAQVLKKAKKQDAIPIISNKISLNNNNEMLELDLLSTAAYSNLNKSIKHNQDFLTSPIIVT